MYSGDVAALCPYTTPERRGYVFKHQAGISDFDFKTKYNLFSIRRSYQQCCVWSTQMLSGVK